jgi:hypothetical protein
LHGRARSRSRLQQAQREVELDVDQAHQSTRAADYGEDFVVLASAS